MDHRERRIESGTGRRRAVRLILGAFLMLLGALLIAENLGFDVPMSVWSYWPFLVMALGAAKLAFEEGESRGAGFWILLAGIYGWIGVFRVAGLTWSTGWPVFLLGGGLWIVICRVVEGKEPKRLEENGDVR